MPDLLTAEEAGRGVLRAVRVVHSLRAPRARLEDLLGTSIRSITPPSDSTPGGYDSTAAAKRQSALGDSRDHPGSHAPRPKGALL